MLAQVIKRIPTFLFRKMEKRKLIGGYYHIISNEEKKYIKHLYSYKNASQFLVDLQYIKKHYHPISYPDYLAGQYPKKSFILTFDDGFAEWKSIILPTLEQLQIPAIFFITTDLIDNKNWMYRNLLSIIIAISGEEDREEQEEKFRKASVFFNQKIENFETFKKIILSIENNHELAEKTAKYLDIDAEGLLQLYKPYLSLQDIVKLHQNPLITIGAHSTKHYKYQKMANNEVGNDIVTSCSKIREITGQKFVPFAFPHSSENIDRKLLRSIAHEHQFIKGFFGEFNYEDDIVIKRYPLDNPQTDIKKIIHQNGTHYLYQKLKK